MRRAPETSASTCPLDRSIHEIEVVFVNAVTLGRQPARESSHSRRPGSLSAPAARSPRSAGARNRSSTTPPAARREWSRCDRHRIPVPRARAEESAQQQAGAREQRQRKRELRHHERAAHRVRAPPAADRARTAAERRGIAAQEHDNGYAPMNIPRSRPPDREQHRLRIEARFVQSRHEGPMRTSRSSPSAPSTIRPPRRRARAHTLDHDETHESRAGGAQHRAQRELRRARRSAHERETGDVRHRDQEHHERRAAKARACVGASRSITLRSGTGVSSRICPDAGRPDREEPLAHRGEIAARGVERHALLEPREHEEPERPAPLAASRVGARSIPARPCRRACITSAGNTPTTVYARRRP